MDYKDHKLNRSEDHFWFKARRNLFRYFFKKAKPGKILNVGTGVGEELPLMEHLGEIHAIDKVKEAVALIPKKYNAKAADAINLPYPDNTFDTVFALEILEHISDDKKAVSEIYRVLKEGGIFIATIPAYKSLWSDHDIAMEHVRRYDSFRPSGFTELRRGHWNMFLLPALVLWRALRRKKKTPQPDQIQLPRYLDTIFYHILDFENILIKNGFYLPFGLTKWGIYKKKQKR